jgi:hypothetical protein
VSEVFVVALAVTAFAMIAAARLPGATESVTGDAHPAAAHAAGGRG